MAFAQNYLLKVSECHGSSIMRSVGDGGSFLLTNWNTIRHISLDITSFSVMWKMFDCLQKSRQQRLMSNTVRILGLLLHFGLSASQLWFVFNVKCILKYTVDISDIPQGQEKPKRSLGVIRNAAIRYRFAISLALSLPAKLPRRPNRPPFKQRSRV